MKFKNVGKHCLPNNIYNEKELDISPTRAFFAQVRIEGDRSVKR